VAAARITAAIAVPNDFSPPTASTGIRRRAPVASHASAACGSGFAAAGAGRTVAAELFGHAIRAHQAGRPVASQASVEAEHARRDRLALASLLPIPPNFTVK
jgi:hypothetical protein